MCLFPNSEAIFFLCHFRFPAQGGFRESIHEDICLVAFGNFLKSFNFKNITNCHFPVITLIQVPYIWKLGTEL